jgi:hypothetical protein
VGHAIAAYSDNFNVDYIAHAIAGDIIGNLTRVLAISRQLHFEESTIPLAPYATFLLYLDDTAHAERMMGVDGDKAIIARAARGMQIFGPKISTGVRFEAQFFKELGRPIILRNPGLRDDLASVLGDYAFEVRPFQLKEEYLRSTEKNLANLVNSASWLEKVQKYAYFREREDREIQRAFGLED